MEKPEENTNDDVEVQAVSVLSSLVSEATLKCLAQKTSKNYCLSQVINCLECNRPVCGTLKPLESQLVVSGVLLKGCKAVIPPSMRPELLRRNNECHLGVNKFKSRACRLLFWQGLNMDIEAFIRRCPVCQKYVYQQQSEP